MQKNKFVFPIKRSVKIKSPYNDNNYTWHVYVNVQDLPSNIPSDVDPRKVRRRTKVFKGIVNELENDDELFYQKNRGILLSAYSIKSDLGAISIDMGLNNDEDRSQFGILDGLHSYRAIIENRDKVNPKYPQYCHLEIMTSIKDIDGMASARNSSVQVNDKAIAELADKFQFIKDSISNQPFSNDIAYKQNERKDIDAIDLIRLMFALNKKKYPNSTKKQPIQSYSGKAQVLKDYLSEYDKSEKESNYVSPYEKLAPLLPTMTKLYDQIVLDMPKNYKAGHDNNSKFGLVKGVETKNSKTKYYHKNISHVVSPGFIFPILGGFRALIGEYDHKYKWILNPLSVWKDIGMKLVNNTISMSRQLGNNPQSAGKSSTLWTQNYDTVDNEKMRKQYEQMKEQMKNLNK